MPDLGEQVTTVCGACGQRREMPAEALKLVRDFECAGCGCDVNLDDYQLSRLLNANDRTPRLTVTLTEVAPRRRGEGRQDIKSGEPVPARPG
jgi:hypothetical protein